MSAFKVGQRVKYVAHASVPPRVTRPGSPPIGTEGAIIRGYRLLRPENAEPCYGYTVEFDGFPPYFGPGWSVEPGQIVPLADPKAEEFIASLEKLAREPLVRQGEIA